jgi:hypothetical protein
VKLVLTLLTRDQADVVDALVAYHIHAGVDFVIAMDHGSTDGTAEILESYEREGSLRLIRQTSSELRTREWRTEMARLAASDHAADWVIGCDGDEFWWPRSGSLKETLAAVPVAFGVVDAPWQFFLPRTQGPAFFAERMTVRLAPPAPLLHPQSPFKPRVKIAHRAHPDVVVQGGNHRLLAGPLKPLPGWHPIDVLHFPTRSYEQYERRRRQWVQAGRTWHPVRSALAGPEQAFGSWVVDDEMLERGLASGCLVIDTRLRDALRALGQHEGTDPFEPSERAPARVGACPAEVAALYEGTLADLARRVDDLAARIANRGPATR